MKALWNLLRRLRQACCRHRFDYADLQGRTSADSGVTWTCWRCGRVFKADYAILILAHGDVERRPTCTEVRS